MANRWYVIATNTSVSNIVTARKPADPKGLTWLMVQAKGSKSTTTLKGIDSARNVVNHRAVKMILPMLSSAKTANMRKRNKEELEMSARASNQVTAVRTILQPASVVTTISHILLDNIITEAMPETCL